MRNLEDAGGGVSPLVLEYAKTFLGTLYLWGGASPGGIDCSGLVIEVLKGAGVLENSYDATAQDLYSGHTKTWPTLIYGASGALAFYGRSISSITHVSFCMDERYCIEAGGGGESVRTAEEAMRRGAFVRLRPIKYRKDFLTMLMPKYS